jgi:FKBP-type peptidyl-prolyl cis-trans isomerase
MDQKQLKTSWQTRVLIGIIAFLMLFSTVSVYALIVLSNKNATSAEEVSSKEDQEFQEKLSAKQSELDNIANELSGKHYDVLNGYRSKVKSYNAKSVDNAGLQHFDLKEGDGAEIKEDSSYYSYYIGWCADESIFDSSYDNSASPSKLKAPIAYVHGETSFVAGWESGVVGMKTGGVREIDIPGALAYGDKQKICGGTNSPLKFIVYVVDPGEEYKKVLNEYNDLLQQYYMSYYSKNQDLLKDADSSEGATGK